MSRLFLYGIFHANLKFSSIPEDHYSRVIDACYWPIIDLVTEYSNLKLGIEFPSSTLKYIQTIDPTLVDQIRTLAAAKKIEILASGSVQCLFPLIPQSINDLNLKLGLSDYRDNLGINPVTGYLNEQAFSSGLPTIYQRNGIRNLILMWEWLVKFSAKGLITDYSPQIIKGSDGTKINAIMNSYIAFQKFQRYIAGEIDLDAYINYIKKQQMKSRDTCFPFYGSDLEIFGYKGTLLTTTSEQEEVNRFRQFIEAVEKDDDISFVTPAEVIELFPPHKEITIDSPEAAIYSKKQDKFIVTRWAVCGRDNSLSNTLCYDMYKKLKALDDLHEMSNSKEDTQMLKSTLIDCWASDNRTHTTESKYTGFKLQLGTLAGRITGKSLEMLRKLAKDYDGKLLIINHTDNDRPAIPFECKMHFPPQKYSHQLKIYINGKETPFQLEEPEFYRDGSLRTAKVVVMPYDIMPGRSVAELEVISQGDIAKYDKSENQNDLKEIETNTTQISFLKNRGGTIDKLIFKGINKHSLAGWLEHGFFNDTRLSADFYTGHIIAFDRNGSKYTDLVRVSTMFSPHGDYPIRIPVYCLVNTPIGTVEKIYYIYTNQPRVDLTYRLNLKEFQPSSFRLGIITLNPAAYDKSKMEFSTNNGGHVEKLLLSGHNVAYDESVDPRVSSHGCLGATEEWIDVGDSKNGITLFSDKARCYSVPLINYRQTDNDLFFYRLYNTISELDDTTMTWWKGQKVISFSYLGRKGSTQDNIDACSHMSRGLILFSNHPSITLE